MAIPSSIPEWRISWTEELGGLQSMGHKEWDSTEAAEHARTVYPEMTSQRPVEERKSGSGRKSGSWPSGTQIL